MNGVCQKPGKCDPYWQSVACNTSLETTRSSIYDEVVCFASRCKRSCRFDGCFMRLPMPCDSEAAPCAPISMSGRLDIFSQATLHVIYQPPSQFHKGLLDGQVI